MIEFFGLRCAGCNDRLELKLAVLKARIAGHLDSVVELWMVHLVPL